MEELIDQQISQLYGPIMALIQEGRIGFAHIQYQLGRDVIIPAGKEFTDLPDNEQKIWIHYVDTYKIKTQMEIVKILEKDLHLM